MTGMSTVPRSDTAHMRRLSVLGQNRLFDVGPVNVRFRGYNHGLIPDLV